MHGDQRATRAPSPADRESEVVSRGQPVPSRKHGGHHRRGGASDGEALAPLAATSGQDRATRTGAHPQAETVHLVTATVVRLVRTLAHELLHTLLRYRTCRRTGSHDARRRQSRFTPTGTACPRGEPPKRPGRGHAAPVEPESTCQRYAGAAEGVNSAGTPGIRSPKEEMLAAVVPNLWATRRGNAATCGEPVDPQGCVLLASGPPIHP